MGAFAAMALVLMTLGVYAVVSYTTAQRTYEIGVRLALGAQRRDIRRLVVINGVGLTAAGHRDRPRRRLRAGAVRVEHALRGDAVGSASPTPRSRRWCSAMTMLATWAPARRAQRVDPVTVLRND